jgi:hypothetical protein
MPTINECRRNAEQCLLWADEPANDEQREKLFEISGTVEANGAIER